jgi:hypothetical protein
MASRTKGEAAPTQKTRLNRPEFLARGQFTKEDNPEEMGVSDEYHGVAQAQPANSGDGEDNLELAIGFVNEVAAILPHSVRAQCVVIMP